MQQESIAELSTTVARCRPMTLGDAMILLAFLGIGMAFAKMACADCYELAGRRLAPQEFGRGFALECGHAAAFPCLAALSIGYLLVRSRRPRPDALQLLMQPGVIASVFALATMTSLGVVVGAEALFRGDAFPFAALIEALSVSIGAMIAGMWLILWSFGFGRAEPGWLDSIGRLLAAGWTVQPLVLACAFLA
jgi:hypothetical protein